MHSTSYHIPQFAKPVGAILDTQKIIMPRLRLGGSPSNNSMCDVQGTSSERKVHIDSECRLGLAVFV